jgi:MYXO-CTERM domain-containing protein
MSSPIRSLRSLKAALTTVTALVALGFAAPASADIPPPEVEQCEGKQVGASCGSSSTCQNSTCGRATPDGVSEYACVKCLASANAPASEKKNCSSAPDALAFGLFGVLAVGFMTRRRTA